MTLSAKIQLIQVSNLSPRDPKWKINIQLFLQQFKFSVYCVTNWYYKVIGMKQNIRMTFHTSWSQSDSFSYNCNSIWASVSSIVQELSHPIHFNTSESHFHMFSSLFRRLYISQCNFHSIYHSTSTAMWVLQLEINSSSVHMYTCVCFIQNYPIFNRS